MEIKLIIHHIEIIFKLLNALLNIIIKKYKLYKIYYRFRKKCRRAKKELHLLIDFSTNNLVKNLSNV